jgi:succinate-semialdehyde dehydrogenase/glutarate-semialdehyde dehydrogenase
MDLAGTSVLERNRTLIAGQWVAAESGASLCVQRPADRQPLGLVPDMGAADTRHAVDEACKAFADWARQPASARADALLRWASLIETNGASLARIICAESGKPIREARAEVQYGAAFVHWFGEEARRCYGEIIPAPSTDRRLLVTRHPVGVVAAITPWNFPLAMVTRKCAPALAAGCTTVVKPSELTPFTAIAAAELALEAGIPAGALNIVTGADAAAIGGALVGDSRVRKLSFTGSTRVGAHLAAQCATDVKRVSLELGGNAPFIVFEDADLQAATGGLIAAKFRNAGQTCVCANRVLVHDSVYEEFAERVERAVGRLAVGASEDDATDIGPLINERAVAKVEQHIADAVSRGAHLTAGGRRHARGGSYFEPTVLRDVPADAQLCREETFGPVVGLVRFSTDTDALRMANDTVFGLAAYAFTNSYRRIVALSEQLEVGMLAINTGTLSTEVAPFGGVKMSGIGREGSRHGLDEYLDIRLVCLGGLS